MGYEKIESVRTISLGGVNKETGKANPKQIEGYYVGIEERPNKFNKDKPQKLYIFQTKEGEVGLFGKTFLDNEMKRAMLGAMTKVVHAGMEDTGKGNPAHKFDVYQDRGNTIDITAPAYESVSDDVESPVEDEDPADEIVPTRATAPTKAAVPPSSDRQKKLQDLLNSRTAR